MNTNIVILILFSLLWLVGGTVLDVNEAHPSLYIIFTIVWAVGFIETLYIISSDDKRK